MVAAMFGYEAGAQRLYDFVLLPIGRPVWDQTVTDYLVAGANRLSDMAQREQRHISADKA